MKKSFLAIALLFVSLTSNAATVPIQFVQEQTAPQGAGGGIPGTPVTVQLPNNVTQFRIQLDGVVSLTPSAVTQLIGGVLDSEIYNFRVAAPIVTYGNNVVIGVDASGNYTVPRGSLLTIYPMWQTVEGTTRTIPAGLTAVNATLTY